MIIIMKFARLLLILFFCLILNTTIAKSDKSKWQKLSGPYGSYIANVVSDRTDFKKLYVVIDGGGVYKSIDYGDTWFEINKGITDPYAWVLTIDPNNSNVLYLGTWDDGIFKSNNGGKTWNNINNNLDKNPAVFNIIVHPVYSNTIYIGTWNGAYKSIDGGRQWKKINDGIREMGWGVWSMDMHPKNPDIIYIGTWGGSNNTIYKTTNGGMTWSSTSKSAFGEYNINSIKIDHRDPKIVYIGTDSGFFKSINGGLTWKKQNTGLSNLFVRDIFVDPNENGKAPYDRIYLATWGGVFFSDDNGDTWQKAAYNKKLENIFIKSISRANAGQGNLYLGIYGGIYRISNQKQINKMTQSGLPRDVNIASNSVKVDPLNSQIIYAGTFGGGIAKSIDGGASWRYINNGLIIGYMQPVKLVPMNEGDKSETSVLLIGTDGGGIFKTSNCGERWFAANRGLTNLHINEIEVDPSNPNIIYAASGGGLFKSIDGAQSWASLVDLGNNDIRDIVIDYIKPNNIFVTVRKKGVYKSTNGGKTWLPINNGIKNLAVKVIKIDPVNSQTLYVGGKNKLLYKTMDGGKTWIEINHGLPDGFYVHNMAINTNKPNIVYIGSKFGHGIYKTEDFGVTWKPFNNNINLKVNDLTIDPINPSHIYAGTASGLFKRIDR